ncbi:MAG: hypothetical protein ACJAYX_003836 [Planctomycetota bacterium]|jgi:hypothetical protein
MPGFYLGLGDDSCAMPLGQFPASAANAFIEGYCDEFLSLASLLAETLAQADSRGIDITASQCHLDRIDEGMRNLGAVIDELGRCGPPAEPAPATPTAVEPDEPDAEPAVTFGTMPILGNESARVTRASTADPAEHKPPAGADLDEVDARVVEAYSFLVDSDSSDRRLDAARSEAGNIDPSAPVHFDKRPAPGLELALKSLPSNAVGAASKASGKVSGDPGDDDTASEVAVNPSLKGSNATMPVRSVFQFLERARKSGVMRVELADEVVTFEFEGGWIRLCRTDNQDKSDRLGELLAGTCNDKELQALLAKAVAMNNLQVGELMVRSGLVSNGQVLDALEAQARLRFQRVCDSVVAKYEFVECLVRPRDGRVRIAPMELAFQAHR